MTVGPSVGERVGYCCSVLVLPMRAELLVQAGIREVVYLEVSCKCGFTSLVCPKMLTFAQSQS